ncbi:MAG: hypothetical protein HY897_23445 [Deltaproteobacteria bacterium]|nr:hypothetical protein [Deltaproteobacteria bacterium]
MKKAQGCRLEAVGRIGRIVSGLAVIGFVGVLAVGAPVAAHAGDAQQALTWLENAQRSDGSWCGADERLCPRDTGEVLQAISQQPSAISSGAVAKGVAFMENVVPYDTGTLARKLAVSRQLSSSFATATEDRAISYIKAEEVEKLKSLTTSEGGFGAWEHFASPDMYRTIPAIQFFAGFDTPLAARAALYLASTQNLDGSFSPAHDVSTTADIVLALALAQAYAPVSAAIQSGLDFIVSQANPDGSIGPCSAEATQGESCSDPVRDTLLGVLAVQTIAGDINNIVPAGVAYLNSQLDAQSSIRGDAYLTALYVRVAANAPKQIGSRTGDIEKKLAGRLPDAKADIRGTGKVIPPKDLWGTPKRKLPSVQTLSRSPSHRVVDHLAGVSDLVGVENGLCTVQDVTPRFGNNLSGGGLALFLDGRPYQIGTPITEEGVHVLMIDGSTKGLRFVIDRTPPTIELRGIADGDEAAGPVTPSIAIQDQNFAGMTTTLNGLPFESGTTIIEKGSYELAVTAWDCAGNIEIRTVSFAVGGP